jgi:hypothetical protein
MSAVTTTATGDTFPMVAAGPIPAEQTYQAYVVGTGAVSATVKIEATNNTDWGYIEIASLAPSGTTSAVAGAAYVGPWQFVRARVSAISGTGAAVSVVQGVR